MTAQIDTKHRLLSHQEELDLFARVAAGGEDARAAVDELVSHNLRLVHKVTNRYHTDDPATEYDDLFQIGVLGLMEAVKRFKPELGNRFSTYATFWIRQRIQREAITAGAIRKSANPNYKNHPSRPSVVQANAIRRAPIARLDAPLSGDDERTLLDVLALDADEMDTETNALNRVEVERLLKFVRLSPLQTKVLRAWMDGYGSREAGERFGQSRSYLHMVLQVIKQRIAYHAIREDYEMALSKEQQATVNQRRFDALLELDHKGNSRIHGRTLASMRTDGLVTAENEITEAGREFMTKYAADNDVELPVQNGAKPDQLTIQPARQPVDIDRLPEINPESFCDNPMEVYDSPGDYKLEALALRQLNDQLEDENADLRQQITEAGHVIEELRGSVIQLVRQRVDVDTANAITAVQRADKWLR